MKKIEKKFKRVRNSVVQSINSRPINLYIKLISENLSSIMKKPKELLIKENHTQKYENSYDIIPDNEDRENHILFLALVTFHHKEGGVIECTFPNKEKILTEGKLNSLIDEKNDKIKEDKLVLDLILNKLINYCLIDGIHLFDNESLFFFIHELPKVLYCFSYFIQKKTDDGENNIEDSFQENIRGCIQKSICIVSTLPFFRNFNIYNSYFSILTSQMNLYMNQKSLNDKTALNEIFIKLKSDITYNKKLILNIKKSFFILKEDLLIILKLIILEKKIIFYSQTPSKVSFLILSLLSIFPGYFIDIKSNFDEQNGTPFKIFHDKYLIFPLFTLYDVDFLLEKINNVSINYLIGITNNIITKNKNLKYSCVINLDEHIITYGEDIDENIKIINGREKKLYSHISDMINIEKNKINENGEKEPWIIDEQNDKKNYDCIYMIKKNIRLYYLNIIYDISYLVYEITNRINNITKEQKLFMNLHFNINNNYKIFTSEAQEEKNNNNNSSKTIGSLPHIESLMSDPFLYIFYTILPINFDYLFPEAKKNRKELEKKRETILCKLNNLSFISEWTKTKNFIKWYLSYSPKIIHLSTLNANTESAKLYDYENNYYEGDMILGKKQGAGIINYENKGMIYVGEFKSDLKDGRGKLYSKDGKYSYVGNWMKDKMEGDGILSSDKLGKYNGLFHADYFEGKGNLTDIYGNIYEGDFYKGFKEGKGKLVLNNGNIYQGEFKHDKYNGKGELKDSLGNIIQKGEFKNGILFKQNKNAKEKEIKDKEEIKEEIKINNCANPLNDENEKYEFQIKEQNNKDDLLEKEENKIEI